MGFLCRVGHDMKPIKIELLVSCDRCGKPEHIGPDEFYCRACSPREKQLMYDVREALAEIDRAYWDFYRSLQGQPPTNTVPEAYATIRSAREELFELGVRDFHEGSQYAFY